MFKTEAITVSGNESCLVSRNRNKKNSADRWTTEILQESCCNNIHRIFGEIIYSIVESLLFVKWKVFRDNCSRER